MDESQPDRICLGTHTLPERDRFPAFYEEIVRRYIGLDGRQRWGPNLRIDRAAAGPPSRRRLERYHTGELLPFVPARALRLLFGSVSAGPSMSIAPTGIGGGVA